MSVPGARVIDVSPEPRPSLVTLTHVIYAWHAVSLLIGITTLATVIGAFLFGWPSIVAVVLNYIYRGDTRATWLASHFRWQIRTFWFGLLWFVLCWTFVLVTFGIGVFVVWLPLGIVSVWLIYRIARGWLRLVDRRPLYE
jgi:uncharacterized membrane protein